MSEYIFGCGTGHMSKKAATIAAKHGAILVNHVDTGCSCGYGCTGDCPANKRHWFTAQNQGHPFDKQLSDAVESDLRAAGLIK